MVAPSCPNRQTLVEYSLGQLSEEKSGELAGHLEACVDCQATMLSLDDAEDTLIGQLRATPGGQSCVAEPEFQAALAEAIGLPTGGAGASTVPQMFGEYQILGQLGRGGMGRVYKALHTKLDRVVAVKILPRGRVGDQKAIVRFEREMKAVGRLAHPNIVQAYDAREIDGTPVLIMEHVDGLDLAEIARRVGPLPIADACEVVRQTALALQYAYEHGMVHRDIKPSNVMLAQSGEVKLLDLGLARFYAETEKAACGFAGSIDEMTGAGQAMGTADYMAPEQASDSRSVDIRADLYSLGCTLYKLLSGRAPFSGPEYRSNLEKVHAHVHQPPPFIRRLVPEVPEKLAAILDRLLAKDPADRFATPAEVAEAIAPWCNGADLSALLQRALDTKSSPLPSGEGQGEGCSSPEPLAASQRWKSRAVIAILLLLFGGFGFWLGVMIRIKRDGQETSFEVPNGSKSRVDEKGNLEVQLPAKETAIANAAAEITAIEAREPFTWQWRVRLPKGARYSWNVGYGAIPADGLPKVPWTCISNEPYWETGVDAVISAALRRVDDKNWSVTVDSRSYNTRNLIGSGSVTIPDATLRPMLNAGGIEETVLGTRGTETIATDKPIILWKRRACPHGEPPSKGPMPGLIVWLQPIVITADGRIVEPKPTPSVKATSAFANALAPVQFGPVIERVVNALGEGKGGDGLELASGNLVALPKEFGTWSREQKGRWAAQSEVDLLFEGPGSPPESSTNPTGCLCTFGTVGMSMAALGNWDCDSAEQKRQKLIIDGLAAAAARTDAATERKYAETLCHLCLTRLPATSAFRTRHGIVCVLQAIGFTEGRRGIQIRYKFVKPPSADPFSVAPAVNFAPAPPANAPLALDGFCPVTLAEEHRWVPGDRRFGAVDRGRTYLFKGPNEQRRFMADPDRYAMPKPGTSKGAATVPIDDRSGTPAHGNAATVEQEPDKQSTEPVLQFGPVIERVINALGEGKGGEGRRLPGLPGGNPGQQGGVPIGVEGGEGLNLASGKLIGLPKEFVDWSAQQRDKWSTENNVDLVVDTITHAVDGQPKFNQSALVPEGLKLGALPNDAWEHPTKDGLVAASASPNPGSYAIMPGAVQPVCEVLERGGIVYFELDQVLPIPPTFAFQTRKGDLGILQVIRYTEEPRGMRIRYKLVQPAAEPGAGMPSNAERATTFRTAPITRGDLVETITATGTVEPEEVIDVSAQVAGQIVMLGLDARGKPVDYGSPVKQGTVLAKIDDSIYKAKLDQAKAGVRRAEAEWEVARTAHGSAAAIAAAVAAIDQAKAAASEAQRNLDYTVITSPFDGVIIDRRVNVGQNVGPSPNSHGLFLIAKNLEKIQVWASVNEADIARIHKGMDVRFTVDAYPKDAFTGTVAEVRPNATMTQNVVTYTVVVATDNRDSKLLPYLTANLQFQSDARHNVLRVPTRALRWRPRADMVAPDVSTVALGNKVWIREPDGHHVRPIEVQIGLTDGTLSEVSGPNLREGMGAVFGEEAEASTNPFLPKSHVQPAAEAGKK